MRHKAINIERKQRFGALVAIKQTSSVSGSICWQFKCDCGNRIIRRANRIAAAIRRGTVCSCNECRYKRSNHVYLQIQKHTLHISPTRRSVLFPFFKQWNSEQSLYSDDDIDEMECDIRALSEYDEPEFLPLYYPAHAIDSEFWPNNLIIVRDCRP